MLPTLAGKTRSAGFPTPAGLCPLRANPRRQYTVNVKVGNDVQSLESSMVFPCYDPGLCLFWLPYSHRTQPRATPKKDAAVPPLLTSPVFLKCIFFLSGKDRTPQNQMAVCCAPFPFRHRSGGGAFLFLSDSCHFAGGWLCSLSVVSPWVTHRVV